MTGAPLLRRDLRSRLRTGRAAFVEGLGAEKRQMLEERLADNIVPHLGPPGVLGAHATAPMEIGITPLLARARMLGWKIAWPRVQDGPSGDSGPLSFHLANEEDLQPGFRGIREPAAEAPGIWPDIVLAPLVGADHRGNRLGQGGGHYDRTLAVARSRGPIMAIGVAWDVQIVDSLPVASWDQPLDAIATPSAFHAIYHADR